MVVAVRCALYTRKSSEEGLEQGFNSLHAQREACESYVKSQVGEGWKALPAAYDDGGFSGGSIDRPGLKALLADAAAGKIDVVVVYKVDRLTRSLADFAKIVETFDAHGVSFVSVTQAFNTTTSMGRLTLNVLLSFAQFEREVTGERIRDKIAASKAKGMWMGGMLPLGYDAPTDPLTRALVVNETEAETVRLIFRRYLELGSVRLLRDWLSLQGIRSKRRLARSGETRGGLVFNRGQVFHLLKNRTYVGEIPHRDTSYPGAHPAIVDRDLFSAVQQMLATQTRRHETRPLRSSSMMLKGLIFDADGNGMTPTFTSKKGGEVYRYYVSAHLQQGGSRDRENETIRRVPAHAIEDFVRGALQRLGHEGEGAPIARVEVHPRTLQLLIRRCSFFRRPGDPDAELQILQRRLGTEARLAHHPDEEGLVRLTLDCRLSVSGGRTTFEGGSGEGGPPKLHPDRALMNGLRSGHRILAELGGSIGRPETLSADQAPLSTYQRRLACLAFLAPDIQAQVLEGRHPPGLTLEGVLSRGVPPSWEDQRKAFGFPCRSPAA